MAQRINPIFTSVSSYATRRGAEKAAKQAMVRVVEIIEVNGRFHIVYDVTPRPVAKPIQPTTK